MKAVKQLSPDTNPSTGGTPATALTSANYIPKKDIVFSQYGSVATKWANKPTLTMVWVTQPNFTTNVQAYRAALTTRPSTGSNRPALTKALHLQDQKDDSVTEVKAYIQKN